MREDVVIHRNSPSLHVMSGAIAFFIYFLMLLLLLGGFHFYREKVQYGEEDAVLAEILADKSIELAAVMPQEEEEKEEQQAPTTPMQENATEQITTQPEPAPTPKEQIIPKPAPQESPKAAPEPKPAEKPQELIEEKPKEVNLDDIFANVSSKTAQEIRKEEEAQRRQEQLAAQQKLQEAQKARQDQLAQNALALEQSTKALQQASQNLKANIKQAMTTKIVLEKPKFSGNAADKKKYDEWYAQIEQILMSEWQKSGNFYQAATSAKVRIRIDAGGKLSYLFMVAQSPYGDYNDSVITFLRKMEKRLFPPPPADSVEMSMELENTLRH